MEEADADDLDYEASFERAMRLRAERRQRALGQYGREINRLRTNLAIEKKLGNVQIEDPNTLRSLLFTSWQHALLQEYRRGDQVYRPPSGMESEDTLSKGRGVREISLGGIAYKNADQWTVWLNGKRVTPKAIPLEVMDIKVYSEYVELEWLDAYNNLIYPVRLRPHQRFNLDSRIFLPGVPAE
jgi:hypothetical protein